MEAGKHIVTANKDLLAVHGSELRALAEEKGLALYYEAAVAGGIPILRTLVNSLAADKVTRILGVLNGTSNFMLTKMVDEGWTYEKALQTAQELGYAESDPTNDVEGIDAAYKAVILSQFAFGMTVDFEHVAHKGISNITPEDVAVAQELGYVIKLVGDIQETTFWYCCRSISNLPTEKSSTCKRERCDECCICRIYRHWPVYVLWTRRWAKTDCNKCYG